MLHCPGRLFPVETRYSPLEMPRQRWEEGFADGCVGLFERTDGDLLAFLPGAAEIHRVGSRLSALLGDRAEVLSLHGSMSLEDQQAVVRPGSRAGRRRVILATSIAETSLTVPGRAGSG